MDEGLRFLRKLTGGSEDIMRPSVSDIYSGGKHFCFFSDGLLLNFHQKQWKKWTFLLETKKLIK